MSDPAGRYRWLLVFDWDGTLVNTLPRKVANAGILLSQAFGCDAGAIERAYRRHSGVPRRTLFDLIAGEVGVPPLSDPDYAGLSQAFTDLNGSALGPSVLFPDVIETLTGARAAGDRIVVSSAAAPDEVRAGVEAVGLAPWLDDVLGSEGAFAKGGGHLVYLEQRFDIPRSRMWMIGDERADLRLGRLAGVRTIGRLGTCTSEELAPEQPVAIVRQLQDMLTVLAGAPGQR